MRLLPLLIAVTPLLAAAGDPELGILITGNIAAQAGPVPRYAGVPMEGSSGQRAERAVSRYRRGQVTPLTLQRSTLAAVQAQQDRAAQSGSGAGAEAPQ